MEDDLKRFEGEYFCNHWSDHTQNGNLNLGDQPAMEDDLKISKVEYLKGNITATICQILSKSEAYF